MIYKLRKIEFFLSLLFYTKNMQRINSMNNGWGQFVHLDEEPPLNKISTSYNSYVNKNNIINIDSIYDRYYNEEFINIEENDHNEGDYIVFKDNYKPTYATAFFYTLYYAWRTVKDAFITELSKMHLLQI